MENKNKLNALTGIRFFAAACIVIGHAHGTFGSAGIATTFALNQGVSIFFVLSGFILAFSYPEFITPGDVRRFWLARFARLWPLHMTAIILLLFLVPPEFSGYLSFQPKSVIFLANMFLIQAWIPIKNLVLSLNGVAWSISTEMFFYLCFPILIWRWRTTWPVKILIVAALVVGCSWVGNYFQLANDDANPGIGLFGVVYTHPLARIFEFGMGVAAYFLYKRILPTASKLTGFRATCLEILCLSLVIASMWLTPKIAYSADMIKIVGLAGARWFSGSGSFLPFALLILVLALQRGVISRFLGTPLLVLLGEISFSMYLVHTIILQFYQYKVVKLIALPSELGYVIYWITILVFSYLLYRGIEIPCRRWIVSIPQRIAGKSRLDILKHLGFFSLFTERSAVASFTVLLLLAGGLKFGLPAMLTNVERVSSAEAVTATDQTIWFSQDGAIFGNEFALIAIDLKPSDNEKYEMQFTWRAQKDVQLKYKVGIHFINESNQIVSNWEYAQSENRSSIKQGTLWRNRLVISKEAMTKAQGIAMAVYERPDAMKFLLNVSGAETDWEGHRLVLRVLKPSSY